MEFMKPEEELLECQELQDEMETSDAIAGCGGIFCCGGLVMMVVALSTGNTTNRRLLFSKAMSRKPQ